MPRPANPELPRQLVEAALALLDERGDATFSMRELASRVGYAVTAVYRCYESRADLLRALQLMLYRQLGRHVDPPLSQQLATAERVALIGRRYLQWALAHPARYLFMFHQAETYDLLTADDRRVARSGVDLFGEIIGQGTEDPAKARAKAVHIFAGLHGLASLALTNRMKGSDLEDLLEFYETTHRPWLEAVLSAPF